MAVSKFHSCVSNRYLIAFMCFLGLLISVGYRTCFALVLTHITTFNATGAQSALSGDGQESIFPHCNQRNSSHDRKASWSGPTTSLFHTAFFAGQFVSSFPSGMLANRFPPKWLFGCTILTTSILFLILPVASLGSEAWIFIIRACQGIVEAMSVPAMNAFISSVATKTDRSRLINIAYAGAYLSPAVAMFATGATICYVSWDSMIYIYGSLGTLWSIVWMVVVAKNPSRHKQGEANERTGLLQSHRAPIVTQHSLRSLPWREIFTSLPLIAIWVASFCRNLVFALLITEVQQYYKDVYALPTATIGLLSAIPNLLMAMFMFPGSFIFDTLIKRNVLSMTKVRKLAQTTGYGIQGVCFLAVGFVDSYVTVFTLLCVGVAFSAFAISGFQTNPLDLAPQYAGALTGIARTGMLGSVVSTVMASQLTGHSHSLIDWQHMFIITGSLQMGGVIFYLMFASGNLQPWALPKAPQGNDNVNGADTRVHIQQGYENTTQGKQPTPVIANHVHNVNNDNNTNDFNNVKGINNVNDMKNIININDEAGFDHDIY